MVKSKEIMLGNWFFVGKGTDWEEKLQVDEVFENSVSFKGREFMTYITSIEPIPITKEILKRNGFIEYVNPIYKHSHCHIYKKYINDCFVDVSHWDDEDILWDVHIDDKNHETLGGCTIKHIHQLQNLLNLCGIELEIKV